MTTVFGPHYASIYDVVYRGKDYAAEVDLIERFLARHGIAGPRRLLDLGCGTGNHAFSLARRGHRVTAIDRSLAMLDRARAKAASEVAAGDSVPTFREADVRKFDLGERFDAALMMFTVLGYLHDDVDLLSALAAVRAHLDTGGLFIFDVWNGPAVLALRPQDRIINVQDGPAQIIRKTRTRLDAPNHLCHVHFDLERTGGGKPMRSEEEHVVRYFFPDELRSALLSSGLRLLDLRRFPDGEAPPDEEAWNVIGVARAQ